MGRKSNDLSRQYMESRMDDLEWLHYRKQLTRLELKASKKRISKIYNQLTAYEEIPSDNWGKVAYWCSRSGSIISGVRMGMKIGGLLKTLMKVKKMFTRKKNEEDD